MNYFMARLEAWYVVSSGADPYLTPESSGIVLKGIVTGHPKKPDGTVVRTSRVVGAQGRVVVTASGTEYWLGEVSESYRVWLSEHRPHWDPERPIVLVGELLH